MKKDYWKQKILWISRIFLRILILIPLLFCIGLYVKKYNNTIENIFIQCEDWHPDYIRVYYDNGAGFSDLQSRYYFFSSSGKTVITARHIKNSKVVRIELHSKSKKDDLEYRMKIYYKGRQYNPHFLENAVFYNAERTFLEDHTIVLTYEPQEEPNNFKNIVIDYKIDSSSMKDYILSNKISWYQYNYIIASYKKYFLLLGFTFILFLLCFFPKYMVYKGIIYLLYKKSTYIAILFIVSLVIYISLYQVKKIPKIPIPLKEPKTDTYDVTNQTLLGFSNFNTENDGYTGNGYVEHITRNGDGIEFKINVNRTAQYQIKIRYASIEKTTCGVVVNNDEQQFTFEKQKYWDSWKYYTFYHQLNAGENRITIKKRSNEDNGNINVDCIEVTRTRQKLFKNFTFLKENNPNLKNDINCEITDTGLIYAYVPSDTDITNLVATYDCTMPTVKVRGKIQQSGVTKNDFTNGHIYNVYNKNKKCSFTVLLYKLIDTKMPNVFVEFSNNVSQNDKKKIIYGINKKFSIPCYFTVRLGKNSDILGAEKDTLNTVNQTLGTIKLRGNTTLHQPKKSWKVKLDAKTAVLDMPKSKHWILLASYDDKSMLRQYISYELARQAFNSCGYSGPRARYCNLFINGQYNGVYLLMEQLKLDKGNRVNADSIKKFYPANSTNLTGGYLLELDRRQKDYGGDEPAELVFTAGGYWFIFKDPDEDVITPAMKNYMADYITNFVNTLKENPESGAYRKYIDVDSFVDWFLTMEIMKNLDAGEELSIYCYKVRDGKLYMGPVWDFDVSSGNINYRDSCMVTSGWHIKDSIWYKYLFKDSHFVQKVKDRYAQFRAGDYDILNSISTTYNYIEPGMSDNFKTWNYLDTYFWPEPDVLHTYKAYVDHFYNWMKARLKWLDENLPNL